MCFFFFLRRARCRFQHLNCSIVECLDSLRLPVTAGAADTSTQIRLEKPEQCYQWGKLLHTPPPRQSNSRQSFEWKICSKAVFFMNYKNLMFILQIQNSHSASFIYFELLQVSAMVQASQSGSRCKERFKIKSFFFFPQTKTFRCVSTPSLMSSACKNLVYLEGWWTI